MVDVEDPSPGPIPPSGGRGGPGVSPSELDGAAPRAATGAPEAGALALAPGAGAPLGSGRTEAGLTGSMPPPLTPGQVPAGALAGTPGDGGGVRAGVADGGAGGPPGPPTTWADTAAARAAAAAADALVVRTDTAAPLTQPGQEAGGAVAWPAE
eukprot:5327412-Alexandrium_andersonii.AAC.1